MRPTIINGHERPVNQVIYNREGDLILTAGSDRIVNVWYSDNGERLGTLGISSDNPKDRIEGQHRAAIWSVDITRNSLKAVTGSADPSVKIWDVSNGKPIQSFDKDNCPSLGSSIRSVQFSLDGNLIACTQDRQMTFYNKVNIIDIRSQDIVQSWRISNEMMMNTQIKWGFMDQNIFTGNEKGIIQKWDQRMCPTGNTEEVGEAIYSWKAHDNKITDLQLNKDRLLLASSSKDKKVIVWDALSEECDLLKEIEHPTNANSCSFCPNKDHIAVGGGEESSKVTTSASSGHFETYLYNIITEEKIGMFKGHFSTINTVAFHPKGHQITTGGEEGNARINNLDRNYLEYKEPEMELVMENPEYMPVESY